MVIGTQTNTGGTGSTLGTQNNTEETVVTNEGTLLDDAATESVEVDLTPKPVTVGNTLTLQNITATLQNYQDSSPALNFNISAPSGGVSLGNAGSLKLMSIDSATKQTLLSRLQNLQLTATPVTVNTELIPEASETDEEDTRTCLGANQNRGERTVSLFGLTDVSIEDCMDMGVQTASLVAEDFNFTVPNQNQNIANQSGQQMLASSKGSNQSVLALLS